MVKSYKNLPKDGSARVMQVATGIETSDATATPQTSPLTYTTSTTTITIPADCAELNLKPSTALKVSEDSTMTTYFVIDADSWHTIPVGRTDYLYIAGETAGGTLNFYFHEVAEAVT